MISPFPRSWTWTREWIFTHVFKSTIAAVGALALALSAPAAAAATGEVVCTVDDPRAVELSGLVATPEGYVSVVDSQFDSDQVVIVYLDQGCGVVRTVGYPTPPRDPEDLAVAPDGALWVADIGDNITATERRQTIALWRIPPDGGPALIHRLTYPDGPHDAEALLFAADGMPVVVTKELGDTSYLYQATQPLEPGTPQGVPMQLVGEFHPVITDPTDLGAVAEAMVTGAAMSPDRTLVALRTYTAAYEWDVPGGDIVQAITTGEPRITPLPDEPQGEAIAYTMDGQSLLTLSDVAGPAQIRRFPVAAAVPTDTGTPSSPSTPTALGTVTAAPEMTTTRWLGYGLAVTGAAVLAAALVGWLGRRRGRR
jgi:hypothetical protein